MEPREQLGDSQESSPTPQLKSVNSSALSFLYGPALTSIWRVGSSRGEALWAWAGLGPSLRAARAGGSSALTSPAPSSHSVSPDPGHLSGRGGSKPAPKRH